MRAELEKFVHPLGHCHLAAVSVLGGSWFKANGSSEQVNLLNSHAQEFTNSPAVRLAHLHESVKPNLWVRCEELFILGILQESFSHIVLGEPRECGASLNFWRCRSLAEVVHPFQAGKFSIDGCVLRARFLPCVHVTRYQIARHLHRSKTVEEWPEMKSPSRLGIGQGLPPIDSVVPQEIVRQFIQPNTLRSWPNEGVRGDLRESSFQEVLRLARIS